MIKKFLFIGIISLFFVSLAQADSVLCDWTDDGASIYFDQGRVCLVTWEMCGTMNGNHGLYQDSCDGSYILW